MLCSVLNSTFSAVQGVLAQGAGFTAASNPQYRLWVQEDTSMQIAFPSIKGGVVTSVESGWFITLSTSIPSYEMLLSMGRMGMGVFLRMSYFPISSSLPQLPRHLTLACKVQELWTSAYILDFPRSDQHNEAHTPCYVSCNKASGGGEVAQLTIDGGLSGVQAAQDQRRW